MSLVTDHGADYLGHQVTLTLAWGPLINIALICILFKEKVILYYLHFVLGMLVIVLTLIGPVLFIMESGISFYSQVWYKQAHNIIGFVMFCIVALQGLSGYLTRISQQQSFLKLSDSNLIKLIHKYAGYVLTILAKFTYLVRYISKWQLLPLIIFQCISLVLYLYLKFRQNSFTPKSNNQSAKDLRTLSLNQINQKSKGNYFILSDRAYSAVPLQNYHPGGVSIIEDMKGRQIDRFVYGGYGPQLNPDIICQHSKNSMSLLHSPIGALSANRPYKGFQQLNVCQIKQVQALNNNQTFLLKLMILQNSPVFLGYSNLSQLGYYHQLTFDNKVIRLYTGVNCLRSKNIKLIQEALKIQKMEIDLAYNINKEDRFERNKLMATQNKYSHLQRDQEQYSVPLLIKKYQKGKLTSNLLKVNKPTIKNKLQISCPKGQGLKLQQIKNGKIIILAGGTGLFPFIDLIDLLFKTDLINRSNPKYQELEKNDPVLANNQVFKNIQFTILLSLRNLSDIHPLSLYQLNSLCKKESTIKLTCQLRCSKEQAKMQFNCPNILKMQKSITTQAITLCSSYNFQRLYICGPPSMQKQILQQLIERNISKDKYQIV